MALIRINAHGSDPVLHGAGQGIAPTLKRALATPGPIAVMLHGYSFQPGDPVHCPHLHILSLEDAACRKALSWPRRLGFDAGGVGIAFGWGARGGLKQAAQATEQASHALARVITTCHALAPDRPIHLIGHSMGGLLALRTLPLVAAGSIGRVVLLNAAAFQGDAAQALSSPAGRSAEIVNVTSRENALYDFFYARIMGRKDGPLGLGLTAPNAVTVRLDDRPTLSRLAAEGFEIAPPRHLSCHWSTYLRPGVFPFYRALIDRAAPLPLVRLHQICAPQRRAGQRGFCLPHIEKQAS